jgi:hypothetical protein
VDYIHIELVHIRKNFFKNSALHYRQALNARYSSSRHKTRLPVEAWNSVLLNIWALGAEGANSATGYKGPMGLVAGFVFGKGRARRERGDEPRIVVSFVFLGTSGKYKEGDGGDIPATLRKQVIGKGPDDLFFLDNAHTRHPAPTKTFYPTWY